jgi:hypothetical protein
MSRSIVAGVALLAGFIFAAPITANSQNQPQLAPTQQQTTPPAEQNMPPMRGMYRHEGMGPMGSRRGWMHEGMMRLSPAQRCTEHLARRSAMIAYTVTKLDLTDQQRALWDKLNAALQAGTQKEQQLCDGLKALEQRGEPTILDRVGRREQFLRARLQMLQQVRPALQELYQALTPEQKAIIDHPFRRG